MIVTTNGIEMDTKKIEAIQKWEALLSVKNVQAFLGFANFHCCFIPGFSKKVKPLNKLTKGTQYTTKKVTKKSNMMLLYGAKDVSKPSRI